MFGTSARSAMIMLGALALSATLYAWLPFEDDVCKSLSLTVCIGVLWLTEALPLAVVALMVPLGALLLGFEGLTTQKALAPFADPIVFLFLGGLGNLVGSPPNVLSARAAGVDFAGWLRIGLPLVGVLMPLMVVTLLLFGGGLALGDLLGTSGASQVLGTQVEQGLEGSNPVLMLLAVSAFMVLLSEFASNTAAAALLIPVFAAIAARMGLPQDVAASYGFALPVATPPNALVFGTGRVPQADMLRAGGALDLVCIAVAALWAWSALP